MIARLPRLTTLLVIAACGTAEKPADDSGGAVTSTPSGTTGAGSLPTGATTGVGSTPTGTGTPAGTTAAGTPPTAPTGDTAAPPPTSLQLCINELQPSNQTTLWVDGRTPDWIELHNPTAAAIDLEGWFVSDTSDDPTLHRVPSSLVVDPGGFVLLYADGSPDAGPAHLDFGLDADGEEVVLRDPWGNTSVVRFGAIGADVTVARAVDCGLDWVFPFRGTPGASNTSEPAPTEERVVVPRGVEWRWRLDADPPDPEWASPAFDDAGWPSGPGPLGFGDPHLVTVLPGEPGQPTAYFRARFDLDDPEQVVGIVGSTLRDDGAVVWVNGVEVARITMPEGPIEHSTPATDDIRGGAETDYIPWGAGPVALVAGENVVAVEIHQVGPSSGDLGFDLELVLLTRP